jgi:catechol 2,3-dioxygenase-like lactoylglutathione lyase family enzyme
MNPNRRLVDHITLRVKNLEKSKEFYRLLAENLGHTIGREEHNAFYLDGLMITENTEPSQSIHLHFEASNPALVNLFHESALKVGCRSLKSPGYNYGLNFGDHMEYKSTVLDPDGNNIEVIFKSKRTL